MGAGRSLRRLTRRYVAVAVCIASLATGVVASAAITPAHRAAPLHASCSSGYVSAIIGGESKCLHAGEFCSADSESDYESYGFSCVDGRLQAGASGGGAFGGGGATSTTVSSGSSAMTDPFLDGFVQATDTRSVAIYTLCFPAYGASLTEGSVAWGDGQYADVGSSSSDLVHEYAYAGSYTVTLTCADSAGNQKQANTAFTVTGLSQPVTTTTTVSAPPVTTVAPTPKPKTVATSVTVVSLGGTIKLAARSQTSRCTRGALPDRQCSPGAYYSGLTKAVLCSSSFRTGTVRDVPESEKHSVETEYGMPARSYGRTIEIDHIASLELGGSNDISNLFPEPGSGHANYHVKDKLENKLHAMVCAGSISLHAAQRGIASNWETLYKKVYGTTP